ALHRHREGGHFALGHIIPPALDEAQSANLLEYHTCILGVLAVFLLVLGRDCGYKTIDIEHRCDSSYWLNGTAFRAVTALSRLAVRLIDTGENPVFSQQVAPQLPVSA